MNRNVESHFGEIPSKNIRRSRLKRDCSHKTTINAGDIIPIYRDEVLPGDTISIRLAQLIRMATPLTPVMDNAWIDTYFFFIPRRLVWEHWKEFMGENTTDAWTQETEYQIPQLLAPQGGWNKGTIASYLGARIGTNNISIDACYTRAYTLCYNEWFRNQNVSEPAELTLGDSTTNGSNGTDYVTDIQKGGMPAKAVKYADYFTRALPEPQKGPDIYLPLGGTAPVTEGETLHVYGNGKPIQLRDAVHTFGLGQGGGYDLASRVYTPTIGASTDYSSTSGLLGITSTNDGSSGMDVRLPELTADLSHASVGPTINELRQAYAIQKMYEIDARGGRAKACASSIKKSRKKTGRLNHKGKLIRGEGKPAATHRF